MVQDLIREIENQFNLATAQRSENRITIALNGFRARNPRYLKYIDYYEGKHDLSFSTDKWKNAFGHMFRQFADNLCPAIVDAAADRMEITGFQVPGQDDLSKQLWKLWTDNRMDRYAGSVHEHVFKTGDAYVIVWPDPMTGEPILSPNPAHQIYPSYSEDGRTLEWAAKIWQLKDLRYRINIYDRFSIEKWVTTSPVQGGYPRQATAFRRFVQNNEPWPVPNQYGIVPVFHFANNAEMGIWGESELVNIVPLQNALNKSVADMLVAMEFVALPQRWATGLEVDEDPITHEPKFPFKAGIDRVWTTGDPDTKFGQFEQADLERFTKVQNDIRLEMARISRTPLHYLGMGAGAQSAFVASMYPSGESLKTAEAPFAAKIRDRQTSFGDTWEDVIRFVAQIGGVDLSAEAEIQTLWTPATPRSITEDLDNALKKQTIGIPVEVIWEELGYSRDQIATMASARQKALAEQVAQANAMKPPVQQPSNATGANNADDRG